MLLALVACASQPAPDAPPAAAPTPPPTEPPPAGDGVLASTLSAPASLGTVIADAAQRLGLAHIAVAEGVAESLVEGCEALELAVEPVDVQNGNCVRGTHRVDPQCGFNLDLRPSPRDPDALRAWQAALAADPAAFDPRAFSNGGTCGWLNVNVASGVVHDGAVHYAGTAIAGSKGDVGVRFDGDRLTAIDLDSIATDAAYKAQDARDADTRALAARLAESPTLADYRALRRRDHGEYGVVLDAAAARLEAELARVPPPIAVGPVEWEEGRDGKPRVSVAVRNTSAKTMEGVEFGLRLRGPDGRLIEGLMCARPRLATTMRLFAMELHPGDTVRVFEPLSLGSRAVDRASAQVVPLTVGFADGPEWESWVTVRQVASGCE